MEHSFDVEEAIAFGVYEAILIRHFRFWILKNQADKRHFHDGRTWTYTTLKAMADNIFPYLSKRQIERIVNKLTGGEEPVLVTGNYNATNYDRTTWYAFNDETLFLTVKTEQSKTPNGEIESPAPDTKHGNRKHQTVNCSLTDMGTDSTHEPDTKPAKQKREEDPRINAFLSKWNGWAKSGWVSTLHLRTPPTAMEIDSRKRLADAVKNPNFDVQRMDQLIPSATALHRFKPTLMAFLGKNKKGEVIWERLVYGDGYVWNTDDVQKPDDLSGYWPDYDPMRKR